MSKILSAKCYQENIESLQKIFLKQKKKSNNMAVNVTKMFWNMKNKSLLNIEKNITESEKMSPYNHKKLLFQKMMKNINLLQKKSRKL